MRFAPDSSLNAIELGTSIHLLRGSTAKILRARYTAVKPNIGRVVMPGQVVTSAPSAADHAFISSVILGSRGLVRFSAALFFIPSFEYRQEAVLLRILDQQ